VTNTLPKVTYILTKERASPNLADSRARQLGSTHTCQICQKRPRYICKETCIHVQRDLQKKPCKKRPTERGERDLADSRDRQLGSRHTCLDKYVQRDPDTYVKRPVYMCKETNKKKTNKKRLVERDPQKETWQIVVADGLDQHMCLDKYVTRDLYTYVKRHYNTHCDTLQHTATHCNTLQHTATHCNTLQHTATHCNTLQHTATHCNTLQHTATHCNTLQHTATHCNTLNLDQNMCLDKYVTKDLYTCVKRPMYI